MRRLLLSIATILLISTALLVAGCGPPWRVVAQAVPNPMYGATAFSVAPIDFNGLRVGEKSEAGYLAEKDQDTRDKWVGDKVAMNEEFLTSLMSRARDDGVQVSPQPGAPFVIHPKVEWVEPGFYAYVASKPSEVHMTLRITTAEGVLVDEIILKHATGASLTNPSSGGRLRDDAEALGDYVGEYLGLRVISQ